MNEAHALTDALLHCTVAGEAADPPLAPSEGDCWIVAAGATGAWTGKDGTIACLQGGNWIFVVPRNGMRVFDLSTGQERLFFGDWKIPSAPVDPSGGATIDVEARAAVGELIAALRLSGILPAV